jgi:rRNA maturation endonuclease Nob1
MEGLLCKNCFDQKEKDFNTKKEFCSICGAKLNFFRYNAKSKWELEGQLCRTCWDSQKTKHG